MKYIPLTLGLTAIVDDEDFAWLSKHKWHAIKKGYAVRSESRRDCTDRPRRAIYMHVEIAKKMGLDTSHMVDHRNLDKADNQRQNLRPATATQNAVNSQISLRNKSGYRGVSMAPNSQKWRAVIYLNRK